VTGAEGEKLKLKWPLNENMVVGFIDFLTKKQTKWHHSNKMKHLAPSTIGHYFSAFRDLYNLHSQPVPDFIDKFFSNTYRKYVLHVSQMKLEGLYPDSTNSIGFSANVYEKICGALVGYWKKGRGASNTVVRYLRLFFIFCYVLLGRGERIGRLRYSWMGWSGWPRGFLPYPLEAPRPPCEFSTSSLPSGAALVSYQTYIYSNAPVSGAVACWVCPHCLTATSSGAFQSQGTLMRRHMREQHKFKDYNSDEVNDYLYKSRLVWCYKPNGTKSWQPVTH
jgi:hypothetical protein